MQPLKDERWGGTKVYLKNGQTLSPTLFDLETTQLGPRVVHVSDAEGSLWRTPWRGEGGTKNNRSNTARNIGVCHGHKRRDW